MLALHWKYRQVFFLYIIQIYIYVEKFILLAGIVTFLRQKRDWVARRKEKKRIKMPKSRVNISVISSIPATDYDVRVLLLSANIITTTMAERLWKMVSTLLLFVLFFKSWNLFAYNFSHYSFTVTNCSCKCG